MAHISYELEIIPALPDPALWWVGWGWALASPGPADAVSVRYYNGHDYCYSIYQ